MGEGVVVVGYCAHPLNGSGAFLDNWPLNSSDVPEGTAATWALHWLISSQRRAPATLYVDNTNIINAARENPKLDGGKGIIAAMHDYAAAQAPVVWTHVAAHTGDPWNEMCDSLAKWAAKSLYTQPPPNPHVADQLSFRCEDLWGWLADAPAHIQQAYPPVVDGNWTYRIEHSEAAPIWPYQPHPAKWTKPIHIRAVSFNVQSLRDSVVANKKRGDIDRRAVLEKQFFDAGIHIVGIQEARTQQDARPRGSWFTIASGHDKAHLGCELWVNTEKPISPGVCLSEHNLTIILREPRLLIVNCKTKLFEVTLVVAHAPDAHTPQARAVWWEHFKEQLQHRHEKFILIDANAQIGSITSAHIHGGGYVQQQNEAGRLMHEACADLDLVALNTTGITDNSQYTWTAPMGHTHTDWTSSLPQLIGCLTSRPPK